MVLKSLENPLDNKIKIVNSSPFGSLSSTMVVGKNKRLTKRGKKGAKKKV